MNKKILSFILAALTSLSVATPVLAADNNDPLYLEAVSTPQELSAVVTQQADDLLLAANSGRLPYSLTEYSVGNPFQIYEDSTLLYMDDDVYYYPVLCHEEIIGIINATYNNGDVSLYYSTSFSDELNDIQGTSESQPAILYFNNDNIVAATDQKEVVVRKDDERKPLTDFSAKYPEQVSGYDVSQPIFTLNSSNADRALSNYIDLDVQETQGNTSDCAAYVTTTIIRTVTGDSVYVQDMYDYFGKKYDSSFSRSECKEFGEEYGLSPKIKNFSRLSNADTIDEIDAGRPIYLGCDRVGGSTAHALCLRGYSGNTYSVWNPWYEDYGSMWISNPFGDEDYIYTAENGRQYVWKRTIYNWG